jgi:glycosyltransferase involved in cell wall biosynthesis
VIGLKVLLASLKFSPGHLSHIIAYAKLFREMGLDVALWLHEDYKRIVQNIDFKIQWFPEVSYENFDIVLFCNPSTINHKFAKVLKSKGSKVIYLYHEPWESFRQYRKEGIKQALKATSAHFYSVKMLKNSDLVIVPSNYALNLYKNKDIKYNENVVMIPLLFDDEQDEEIDITKKQYFSYIGHAVKGHAFDIYIDLIKYIYKQGIDVKFQIATRTNLSKLLKKDKILKEMIKKEFLRIAHGRSLPNSEINQAYKESFCIWNVYRRSTQSGVLPKAYMFGSPVIASKIGSFPEFINPGKTGEMITLAIKLDEVMESILKIKRNIKNYSIEARQFFIRKFYYKAYSSILKIQLSEIFLAQNEFQ